MADDLSSNSEFRDLMDRVRRLETGIPLQNGAVTKGRLRFIGGTLRVDSGGRLEVVGTLQIDGATEVTGSFTVAGPWSMTGDGTITGATSITGDVTLTGDLTVSGAGKIKAGNVEINPSTAGGQIGFGSNRRIDAGSGYLGIYDGSRFVVFNASGIAINGGGGVTLIVTSSGIQATGLPTVPKASVPGSFTDAIVQYSGELRRVV